MASVTIDDVTVCLPQTMPGIRNDRIHIIASIPTGQLETVCSCGNWRTVHALTLLMCNHWVSPPNTLDRRQQAISAVAAAIKLLGADIQHGQIVFRMDEDGVQLPPKWRDGEEKMMAICPACFRFMLEAPAQLPPEEIDVAVTERVTEARTPSTMRRIANGSPLINKVAEVCEWLFRAW